MFRFLPQRGLFHNFCSFKTLTSRGMSTVIEPLQQPVEMPVTSGVKRPLEEGSENVAQKQKVEEGFSRVKKRNFAMLMGYLGKDYYGMQRNPGMKTIEEELINAMFKANLISTSAFDIIQNINFQRAARTDKGVSAIRQIVSLKLPENPCTDSINEHLPEDIRIFGIKRVTKGFNSKNQCDARTYSYTIPTYAFIEEDPEHLQFIKEDYIDLEKRIEHLSTVNGQPLKEYRLTPEQQEKLTNVLKLFEGSRHFHNYTAKVKPLDPRGRRFIMSFTCDKPFIYEGMEFITLEVKGQSFMLHQIRKMVAMVIGLMRNLATEDDLTTSFNNDRVDIPIAPGLGLVLNHVHYDYYNKRYGTDGIHDPLDWVEHDDEIKKFKETRILKHITETEATEKPMLEWLGALTLHSFSTRETSRFNTQFGDVPNSRADDTSVSTSNDSAIDSANDSLSNSTANDSVNSTINDTVCDTSNTPTNGSTQSTTTNSEKILTTNVTDIS